MKLTSTLLSGFAIAAASNERLIVDETKCCNKLKVVFNGFNSYFTDSPDCSDPSANCSAICNKSVMHEGRWSYDCHSQTGNFEGVVLSIVFDQYGSWQLMFGHTAKEWIDGELWYEYYDENGDSGRYDNMVDWQVVDDSSVCIDANADANEAWGGVPIGSAIEYGSLECLPDEPVAFTCNHADAYTMVSGPGKLNCVDFHNKRGTRTKCEMVCDNGKKPKKGPKNARCKTYKWNNSKGKEDLRAYNKWFTNKREKQIKC